MLGINMKTDNKRLALSCLLFFAPLYFSTVTRVQAQATLTTPQPQSKSAAGIAFNSVPEPAAQPRRVTALRVINMSAGSHLAIVSDAPLDDYTAYREVERFYILIPRAEISLTEESLEGQGFTSARAEQRGVSVLLWFHLQGGVTARASQNFNQIDVFFERTVAPGSTEKVMEHAAPTSSPPLPPAAPDSTPDLKNEDLPLMLRRIENLEARIRELETRLAENAPSPAAATPTTAPSSATSAEVLDPAGANSGSADHSQMANQSGAMQNDHEDMPGGTPRMQIQGFAEVNYRATNEKGRTNSFSLGQLDLFLTSRLSEKFSVLGELILEAGEDNAFTFEIHRLLLKYSLNDYFNVSAGRYHTAIGFYNTAYHHGSWFQTTVNRPFLFAFESRGGILPLHNVGVTATGRIPSAPFGLRYVAEIGNGRAARTPLARPVQTAVDENNGKSFNLGLFARPSEAPGLQTGFSVYRDRLTPSGGPNVGQTIMAAHLIYQTSRNEFLNEVLAIRHATPGRVFYIPGFYTQFSRRFGNYRPFFRYQYVNAPGDDPIFRSVGRRNGPSLGLRYDLSDFANFKIQYDRTARRGLKTLDELILQLAFTF